MKLTKYITIPAPFIEEQYLRFNRYPIRRRFDAMADYMLICWKIQYAFTVHRRQKSFEKEIRLMFAGNNDIQVYKDFKWTNNPGMSQNAHIHLEYSDRAPLAYLHLVLEGNEPAIQSQTSVDRWCRTIRPYSTR